jgi:hypothetical protein
VQPHKELHPPGSCLTEFDNRFTATFDGCFSLCTGFTAFSLALIYFSKCIVSPERSLGSNHVVFGGIISPASAMFIN